MWVFLLGVSALAGGCPFLFDGDMQWYVSVISRDFIIFCTNLAALLLIPYSRPGAKVIWSIWTFWQFVIFATKAVEIFSDLPVQFWSGLSWLTTAFFVLWIFSRKSHAQRQRPPADGHFYYVLTTPRDVKSLLVSLFLRPYSGLKIYLDGAIWGFRKGHGFVRLEGEAVLKKLKHSRMVHIGSAEAADRQYLNSLLGTPWSMKNNCYALLEKHFGPVRNYV